MDGGHRREHYCTSQVLLSSILDAAKYLTITLRLSVVMPDAEEACVTRNTDCEQSTRPHHHGNHQEDSNSCSINNAHMHFVFADGSDFLSLPLSLSLSLTSKSKSV